jgi:hypothetical protein
MTVPLMHSATFALDLAKQRHGYLALGSEAITELRNAGLVTTQNIGDGYMIVKAVPEPALRRVSSGRWIWRFPVATQTSENNLTGGAAHHAGHCPQQPSLPTKAAP